MTVPKTQITKTDGNTGVQRPSPEGVLVIIAPAAAGTVNQPAAHTSDRRVFNQFSHGPLTQYASIFLQIAKKPVVCLRGTASTPATYGAVTTEGGGTSVVTAGVTLPYDDFKAKVRFPVGGTVGVAGILYQESLDGGTTWSGTKALGVATSILLDNSNVTLALAAGTILANQVCSVTTTGPRMTNADIVTALEALRTSQQVYEAVLVHGEASATTFATVAGWIAARNAEGKFKHGYMNARFMDAGETESAYKTALDGIFTASSSIDMVLGADGGTYPSPLSAYVLKRPTALFAAARAMGIDIAVEPAYVALGPIEGLAITDAGGMPRDHNEEANPGLDDSRFTTLRTLEGETGTFINNTRLFSPNGSDYQFLPHARVMNAGCVTAFQILNKRLSMGVAKNADAHIQEADAQMIELGVESAVGAKLVTSRRASDCDFVLSREDDLSSNAGAILSGELAVAALVYIKGFLVNAKFVKKITAQNGTQAA